MRIGIVIPTFNESKNVEMLVDGIYSAIINLKGVNISVLFVDDSSPDGTAKIISVLSQKYKSRKFKIEIVIRNKKDGLGSAYDYGLNILLRKKIDYVITMDADLSHNPKYITNFVECARLGHKFVIGSRYVDGGDTPDWSILRRFISWSANIYTKILLGGDISDYTGGFNLFESELLRNVLSRKINTKGYGYLVVLKYYSKILNNNNVLEIPIVFEDRIYGQSKIPKSTIIRSFFLVLRLKSIDIVIDS